MARPLAALLAFASLTCGGADPLCPDPAPWKELLSAHRARYPALATADALKLLQQATIGSEHAVRDTGAVQAWMDREWNTMETGPAEPIVDTLGRGGRYARVHLRPYRDAAGDPALLTAAFIATANRARTDTTVLACAIAAVTPIVPWDSAEWQGELARWRTAGYPAMHHSAAFDSAHRPAYRVVHLEEVPNLLRGLR